MNSRAQFAVRVCGSLYAAHAGGVYASMCASVDDDDDDERECAIMCDDDAMIHLPVDVRRVFGGATFADGRVQIVALLDDLGHLLAQPLEREDGGYVACTHALGKKRGFHEVLGNRIDLPNN